MAKTKKKVIKIVLLVIAAVIVLTVVGTALSIPFSYGVQNIMIKVACNDKNPSAPSDYESVKANTVFLGENLDYGSLYGNDNMDIIAPKGVSEALPLVVYLHGGYYVGGDKKTKEPYCRVIAEKGYVVANVNYALAPEEKYPVQLRQANEAIAYLIANAEEYHIDSDKIFIGGDSAGGHLTGMLGAYYTNPDFTAKFDFAPSVEASCLKGLLLLCGFYNMDTVDDNYFFLLPSAMWMFTGTKKYMEYSRVDELSTVKNVTENYPAVFITCGDKDPFYSQNQEMTAKLKEKGVYTVAYLPESTDKKLKHEFQSDFTLAECATAMEKTLAFLAERSA